MEGVKISKLKPVHLDERGEIWDLLNEKVEHVGFLTSKKGSLRGNHYFKTSKRYAYIWEGKYKIAFAHADKPDEIEEIILDKGHLIEISPNIIHTFVAMEDSILLGLDTTSRANDGYDKEMVRINIVK